jgi:hypothetical protein
VPKRLFQPGGPGKRVRVEIIATLTPATASLYKILRKKAGVFFHAWLEAAIASAMVRVAPGELPAGEVDASLVREAVRDETAHMLMEENVLLRRALRASLAEREALLDLLDVKRKPRFTPFPKARPSDYEAVVRQLVIAGRSKAGGQTDGPCGICGDTSHPAYACPRNPMRSIENAARIRSAAVDAAQAIRTASLEGEGSNGTGG